MRTPPARGVAHLPFTVGTQDRRRPAAAVPADLGSALDALAEGLLVVADDGHVVHANDAAATLLGVPRADLEGAPLPAEVFVADGAAARRLVAVQAPSGGTRWLSVAAAAAAGAVTPPGARLLSLVDVTSEVAVTGDPTEAQRLLAVARKLTGIALWEWDLRTDHITWSPQMYALVGLDASRPVSLHDWQSWLDPLDRERSAALEREALAAGVGWRHEFRTTPPDGRTRTLRAWTEPVTDDDGNIVGIIGATLDITLEAAHVADLEASRAEFRLAFDEAPIGMTMFDVSERGFVECARNRALTELVGTDVFPTDPRARAALVHPDDLPAMVEFAHGLQHEGGQRSIEVRAMHADGTAIPVWVHAARAAGDGGRTTRVILHVVDMRARRAAEQELERLALTDPVTGLGNRTRLEQQLGRALEVAGPDHPVGLLLLDLDRFKVVNDSLGHVAGDALLVEVGRRLGSLVPRGALVCRLGGDEFAVLLDPAPGAAALLVIATTVRERLSEPFTLADGATLVMTASVGVTGCSEPGRSVVDLYREADLALYQAKDRGRDVCAVFDDALRARADERIEAERRLRAALLADGVRLHLQPVVDLGTGDQVAAEALARLAHPELGLIPPADFIGVAEDTGLIVEIDARVTELAVARLAHPDHPAHVRIAVNVSARTLDDASYLRRLTDALARYGVPADRLLVELTESSLLDASGRRASEVHRLHALGVHVGLDDFGTGYSALAYLDRFPLDFLKIDRSFVAQLGTSARADAVVSAIVSLAHAHGLVVTAEGVETREQADALRRYGCDRGQGWLFGRPAPI